MQESVMTKENKRKPCNNTWSNVLTERDMITD